ncbi:MAG TPA: hypothetical protein VE616_03710 [Candidatus Udaeobacter sp.]|jgi:hypothetical protein|nr:hypothetical protein [Candidatus Udaeobacter sp.]
MAYYGKHAPSVFASCVLLSVCLLPKPGLSQEDVVQALKKQLSDIQNQLMNALQRIEQLEKEKSATSARVGQVEQSVRSTQSAPSILNPAIGMVIDATAEHRAKAGGDFNFRAAEVGIAANIDPYARAYAFITGSKEEFEVEEAAIVTTSLPFNLQARAGRFFADFGRLAKFHPHEYAFVNTPLSLERIVGGESKADGIELSYLFPTPFFLRGTMGGYNKLGAENERLDDTKSRAWSRFTYLGRLQTYFDLHDNHSIELGTSLAYTPSIRIPADPHGGNRTLTGVDLIYRYQPLASTLYQGVTLGGELFGNSERVERASGFKRMFAPGGYAYGEAKINREWSAGFLFDNAPSLSSPGKKTNSYSPFITWNLSEFNRLRFQYSYFDDKVREEKSEQGSQFFLQWTTVLGSHTHGFRNR